MPGPERNWILNPSDFAFLWEECKRCFYLKVVSNFRRPRSLMPRIFTIIDAQMKEHYAGKRTSGAMPYLPPGVIDSSASWVQSVPLPVTGHTSTCTIRGKLDTVVRFDEGAYGVIDFKTSGTRSQHVPFYGRQLHAYAFALENAASGNLSLSPVSKLGLIVFEPDAFSNGIDRPGSLTGSVNWIEIIRDDSGFVAFLKEVLDFLELPNPPAASPSCEWCQYREASRRTGL
jgi:hypothetical protein